MNGKVGIWNFINYVYKKNRFISPIWIKLIIFYTDSEIIAYENLNY